MSDDLVGKVRRPSARHGLTFEAKIISRESGQATKIFMTVGLWSKYLDTAPEGAQERTKQPYEVFIRLSKQGSTLAGFVDSIAILISTSLQNGADLKDLCHSLINQRFEPMGSTDDPEVPSCSSVSDYIARRLAMSFLEKDDLVEIGMLTLDGNKVDPIQATDPKRWGEEHAE